MTAGTDLLVFKADFLGHFFKQSCTSSSKSKGEIKTMFFGPTNSAVWVPSDLFHPMFCVRQTWWPSGGPHLTSVVGQYVRPDHLTSVVGLIWLLWWASSNWYGGPMCEARPASPQWAAGRWVRCLVCASVVADFLLSTLLCELASLFGLCLCVN